MIILFQTLFIVFILFALANVVAKKRAGLLGPKGLSFWIIFWLAAGLAVLWPKSTSIIANRLGIGRGTDFVMYVSVSVIFYILFKLHVKVESIGRDITRVVRKETLEQNKKL